MDFRLPDDHQALAILARTIIGEHCRPERLGTLESDGQWLDRELWASLASAGLVGISLPADVGGAGLDALADHVLLREVGAHAAHVPLFETTILAAGVIDRCATGPMRAEVLGAVVAGERLLTAALEDDGGHDPTRPTTRASAIEGGFLLNGRKTLVSCASVADAIVVTATTDDGQRLLALVDATAAGLQIERQRTPSDVPHSQLVLSQVEVTGEAVLAVGDDADDAIAGLLARARAGLASMQAGLVEQAVAMAASHTSTREQFGRPIATFQAVRQRVADARIASELLSLASLQAAWLLSEGETAIDEVLIAKWWAGEAGHLALHAVHHVHGGIGVDREYPLHRLFGRAKSHEFALGSNERQLEALGARLAGTPSGPPTS